MVANTKTKVIAEPSTGPKLLALMLQRFLNCPVCGHALTVAANAEGAKEANAAETIENMAIFLIYSLW